MHINDNTNSAGFAPTALVKSLNESLPKGEVILNPVAQALFAESNDLTKGFLTIRNSSGSTQGNLAGVYFHPLVPTSAFNIQ
jgi:hypothetical protein